MRKQEWLKEANNRGARYILIIMDSWDGDIFPTYCRTRECRDLKYKEYIDSDMFNIKETIDVSEENRKNGITSKRYRKKPVEIDALQWTGDNLFEIDKFIHAQDSKLCEEHGFDPIDVWDTYKSIVDRDGLYIDTLEGTMYADIGDYIIKGVEGEFYPCKENIFKKTYDLV